MSPFIEELTRAVCIILTIGSIWILFLIATVILAFKVKVSNWIRFYLIALANTAMVTGTLLLIIV